MKLLSIGQVVKKLITIWMQSKVIAVETDQEELHAY